MVNRFSHTNAHLIEYPSNNSKTTGNLWFYSKDESPNFNADIADTNSFKVFMYKSIIKKYSCICK